MSRVRIPSPAPILQPAMTKYTALLLCLAGFAFAQDYKLDTISSPPPGLAAAYTSEIQTPGYRVTGPSGPWCEIWFRKTIPTGAKPADQTVAFPIAQGTLLAILR